MLRIRNQQYLPDGRSVLDTIGGPRFRVLSRQVKDGYYVSEVEFVKDTPVESSKREGMSGLLSVTFDSSGAVNEIEQVPVFKGPSSIRFFSHLVLERFYEKSNLSSLDYNRLARLCTCYLVLMKSSDKLLNSF